MLYHKRLIIIVRSITFCALLLFLSSCGNVYKSKIGLDTYQQEGTRAFFLDEEFVHLKGNTPANNKKSALGLALSGGGIRSAAYSLGVLKQLSDSGALEQVDVISSVSGGGYAAYWLYNKEFQEVSRNNNVYVFGKSSLSNDPKFNVDGKVNNFLVNTCSLMSNSSFFTWRHAIWALANRVKLSKKYEDEIRATFGDANSSNNNSFNSENQLKKLISLQKDIDSGKLPNWIINSTVRSPKPKNGILDGTYEFTPYHSGNSTFGFFSSTKEDVRVPQAVAISGAAEYILLSQKVKSYASNSLDSNYIKLSDGGHSENLGVIALLRRKVPHIIVVDAEQDREYEFQGYYILKKRLNQYGLDLRSKYLDCRVDDSNNKRWWQLSKKVDDSKVTLDGKRCSELIGSNSKKKNVIDFPEGSFVAKVVDTNNGDSLVSTLYYNKLSAKGSVLNQIHVKRPASGYQDIDEKINVPFESRYAYEMYEYRDPKTNEIDNKVLLTENAKFCKALNVEGSSHGSCKHKGPLPCESLRSLFAETNLTYDRTVEMLKQNALIRIDQRVSKRFDNVFPMKTTADQNFFLDEFSAYMGLGYMQSEQTQKLYDF